MKHIGNRCFLTWKEVAHLLDMTYVNLYTIQKSDNPRFYQEKILDKYYIPIEEIQNHVDFLTPDVIRGILEGDKE